MSDVIYTFDSGNHIIVDGRIWTATKLRQAGDIVNATGTAQVRGYGIKLCGEGRAKLDAQCCDVGLHDQASLTAKGYSTVRRRGRVGMEKGVACAHVAIKKKVLSLC